MSQLHIFSSLQSFQRGQLVLSQLSADDDVLLRADALYQLLSSADFATGSYAVKADALARGLDPEQFTQVSWIDYDDWVDLVLQHDANISW
ncbi:MAG: sulfurtransferase complex subunit TusB [Idiomarina sp.]|nr:sulfurtransferase complex subunit TusB [Idiomarina sp.]